MTKCRTICWLMRPPLPLDSISTIKTPCSPKSPVRQHPLFPKIPCSPKSLVPQNPLFAKIPCSPKSLVRQHPLFAKITCSPKSPVRQNPLFAQISCSPKSPVRQNPLFAKIPCSPKSNELSNARYRIWSSVGRLILGSSNLLLTVAYHWLEHLLVFKESFNYSIQING